MIDLQQVINSSISLRLVSALARSLSPKVGYQIADSAADRIARQQKSRLVQAVRANQWVIHGERLNGEALDRVVHRTFRYWAHCIFDLYHYIQDSESAGQLILLDSSFEELARRPELDRRGLMIVGLHLSNFDLVLQWLCKRGMKPLVLTLPDPQGGRRIEYELRKKIGMTLLPASVGTLRQALKHLQRGGMVVTGIDRPVPNPEVCPRFFGIPAALPMHSIFLATKAHVPIVIAVTYLQPDGKYHVVASDLIEMDPATNSKVELLHNGEKVLGIAEEFIRQAPEQWSVPLPVWPQIMDFVPN